MAVASFSLNALKVCSIFPNHSILFFLLLFFKVVAEAASTSLSTCWRRFRNEVYEFLSGYTSLIIAS